MIRWLWLCAMWLALAPATAAQDPEPAPLPAPEPAPQPVPEPAPQPAPAQGAPAVSADDPAAVATAAIAKITPQSIMAHLKVLSSDDFKGREAGTREARRAADYVATQLRKAGCEPLGDEGTYFQPFTIPGRLAPDGDCSASVIAGARELSWIPDIDCRPFGRAADPEASGSAVFCGYGISEAKLSAYDDFAGIEVRDKIVVVLRYTPRQGHKDDPFPGSRALHHAALSRKVRLAADRGARGVVVVTGPDRSQAAQRALDAAGLRTPIPAMQVTTAAFDRALQHAGLSLAALQQAIEATGKPASRPLPLIISLRAAMREVNSRTDNVIGVLRGRDPTLRAEAIVIGGHYDHVGYGHFGSRSASTGDIHNGADDNASGTSGVIAIAQTFKELGVRPRRSVIFMGFGAEEKGLLGSRHYSEHPTWPLKQTVAMINLDMIGRGAERWCSVNGVGTSPGFKTLVEHLNKKVGLQLAFSDGGMAPSDNTWFYRRNIPVLFFYTGTHPEYHSPGDDWALIERDGIARVVRLAFLTLYVLAEADERPEFRRSDLSKIPRLRDPSATRRRRWLGITADSRDKAPGVQVQEVDPASPAAEQGVTAGDRIIAAGELDQPTAAQLETILQRMTAGDRLTLRVVRDGTERTVTITLTGPFAKSPR